MQNPWKEMRPGKNPPEEVDVIIEIRKGSQNKYELDKDCGMFRLDRVLHSPFKYEWDYGLIPQTLAEDGDPADGIVIIDEATFSGAVISVRPIGIMHMVDDGEKDDKVISVAADDPSKKGVRDLSDLPKRELEKMRNWFENYKKKEGKKVSISGFEGADAAKKYIKGAIELYKKKVGK